ncbi:Phosphatidyl-N-methylethanolamine N-methyltransferase [Tulasnella sp. 330]|nr:Phosphatidyl-N-methylethanolamine N-methyltransferase [Tulasnella sp. 330]KAG8881624.1 Phosphatidyl-N-methylethanolamine N-methyltransferase [Tulasnella sp. 331]KAG8887701.1 Phosphatidyl-N-methylethanolamine N-methyltransferase [Tulasnella sp. 332]
MEAFYQGMQEFKWFVDIDQPSLPLCLFFIVFNPTFWNYVAQNEYNEKTITKLLGGRRYLGCYLLAIAIFSLGIVRDYFFYKAIQEQPKFDIIPYEIAKPLAYMLFIAGQVLVLSSTWALGITGTYLGDYFGILMDEKVTGFPFNIMNDPMYNGSTMCFLAHALWARSAAGVLIAQFVYMVYSVALSYEGPFTAMIYSKRSRDSKKKSS